VKEIKRKVLAIAVALMAVVILATPLLGTAEACGFRRRWRRATFCGREMTVTDMDDYTEYVGTLGGANFVIRIPNEWNGMLIVGCHEYLMDWYSDAQFQLDNLNNGEGIGLPFKLVEQGFAYAASSYGEGGWAVKKGMTRTLQLTMFSLGMLRWQSRRCHNIKVFLVGVSMGGTIALLLGEKYPMLYDGVLDIVGNKEIITPYLETIALMNNPDVWNTLPPPIQAFFIQWKADVEAACGGTYDEKPKAYERLSPTYHADISIPIVSIHGLLDPLVPPPHALLYQIAVTEAGCSEYYRAYTVPTGSHADPPVIDEALIRLEELVNYPVGW
jgi:hypothetical protein